MASRRECLDAAAVGGLGVRLRWPPTDLQHHHAADAIDEGCILSLPRFVDRLPIPPVAQPAARYKWATYYEIPMTEFKQQLHRDLQPTTVWGYAGTYPG